MSHKGLKNFQAGLFVLLIDRKVSFNSSECNHLAIKNCAGNSIFNNFNLSQTHKQNQTFL